MADVSGRRPAPRRGERGDGRDRGQLFLAGALTLATLFVALALFLNGVIYAGTLATDDAGADTDGALAYRSATDGVVRSVNAEYRGDYATLADGLEETVRNWSEGAGRHHAARGVATNASLVEGSTVYGTRIAQRDASRNFTDDDGNASWTLVADSRVRAYELVVDRSSLVDGSGAADDPDALRSASAFTAVLTNAGNGERWAVFVYRTSDGIGVTVERPDGSVGRCDANASTARIDLTDGELDERSCPALDALDWTAESHDIEYEHGGSATGTYSLVVAKNAAEIDDAPYPGTFSDGSGPSEPPAAGPYRSAAVYAAELDLTYRSPSLTYETRVRVTPGEPDA